MKEVEITTPLTAGIIEEIVPGCIVKITGTLYTARDATHQRLIDDFKKKKKLPFEMKNQIIYYAGPAPAPGGRLIGSCGPTTAIRMEPYLNFILSKGIKAVIGKGPLNKSFVDTLKKYNAVYLLATGGAGAYLAKFIKNIEIIAYKDLGPQAIYKLDVENFPCIAAAVKDSYILKSYG